MPSTDVKNKPRSTEVVAPPTTLPERYDPAEIEVRWQQRWDADPELYRAEPENSGRPKYYVLEMLPLSVGPAAHGARAQLLHWGCPGSLHVDAGL